MPLNACVHFYDCPACHVRLKPHEGDCCIFCSYGSVPCPSRQGAGQADKGSGSGQAASGRWRRRARALKKEVYALYLAYRDPRTPWYGKVFTALVVAYAFSPIDLIPDPIPVLGYLDDLILIPIGVMIALRMIPAEVMSDARLRAEEVLSTGEPTSWVGAAIVGTIWLALAGLAVWLLLSVRQAK
jgi:uncharacterized membrane protein YkvA (DUF1232 family)